MFPIVKMGRDTKEECVYMNNSVTVTEESDYKPQDPEPDMS